MIRFDNPFLVLHTYWACALFPPSLPLTRLFLTLILFDGGSDITFLSSDSSLPPAGPSVRLESRNEGGGTSFAGEDTEAGDPGPEDEVAEHSRIMSLMEEDLFLPDFFEDLECLSLLLLGFLLLLALLGLCLTFSLRLVEDEDVDDEVEVVEAGEAGSDEDVPAEVIPATSLSTAEAGESIAVAAEIGGCCGGPDAMFLFLLFLSFFSSSKGGRAVGHISCGRHRLLLCFFIGTGARGRRRRRCLDKCWHAQCEARPNSPLPSFLLSLPSLSLGHVTSLMVELVPAIFLSDLAFCQ